MTLRLAILSLALLVSAVAQAVSVVVLEFPDTTRRGTGRKVREQTLSALRRADVQVIPLDELRSAARRKRIKARDIDRPENIGRLCTAIGADGSVSATRAGRKLHVVVIDREGRQIWDRELDVDRRGLLKGDTPRRLAKAVTRALTGAAESEAQAKLEPTASPQEPSAVEEPLPKTAKVIEVGPGKDGDTGDRATTDAPRETRVARGGRADDDTAPRRRKQADDETGWEDDSGGSTSRSVDVSQESRRQPPWAHLDVVFAATWRTYRFCPGVASCDDAIPAGAGTPIRYTTEIPYGGVEAALEVFPLAGLDSAARGLGITGHYAHSFLLRSRYQDPSGEQRVFTSSEERFGGEGMFRFFIPVSSRVMWLTARVGYEAHNFLVDTNPVITESRRGGLLVGADVSFPIWGELRVNARFQYLPLGSPGEREREAYGGDAAGSGFFVRGGFSYGELLPVKAFNVGLFINLDIASFGDRFSGQGRQAPLGGVASETYFGVNGGALARF